ncbi:trypsin-like peptidase domain-containing protein [Clostridium diolis]|uniref:trypsin-like peptidase domain-containing protein n=1 Tax=Clostridium diolis TaxID=223919 RepID=UPI003AF698CA
MDKSMKLEINDFKKPIFFPFTDPFIQVVYNYTLEEIEYFLKICLFLGTNIHITSANLWQSSLSMELFNKSKLLFDLKEEQSAGLIKLSTRSYSNTEKIFSQYFEERLSESGHFINLPGELELLDFQIPQTYSVATSLDNIVKPYIRIGGDVTKVLTENIESVFAKNKLNNNKLKNYIDNNYISRASIADSIINSPYNSNVQKRIIIESNKQYYIANAIANNSQLIYPQYKRRIFLYNLDYLLGKNSCSFQSLDISNIFDSIGLSYKKISSISYDALYVLEKCGILNKFRELAFLFIMNRKKSIIFNIYRQSLYSVITMINRICSDTYYIKKLKESTEDIILDKDILCEKTIFYCNLHHQLINGGEKKLSEIKIPIIIQECINKFSLDQLKNICIDVADDYELFSHRNKRELARELCLECKRKNKLDKLISVCIKENSTFSVYSEELFIKNTITEWKASGESGEKLTIGRYEEIINKSHKFHSIQFIEKAMIIKKRICMLEIKISDETDSLATGFLISDDYILTNKHVIPYPEIVIDSLAWFDFEDTNNSRKFKCKLDFKNTYISDKYDIAITKILRSDNEEYFKELPSVILGEPIKGDCIPIIQHANGCPKQVCIGYNSLKYADGEILQYLTNTLPGSSGAAVFDSNWGLIGIHSKGGEIEPRSDDMSYRNEGINIKCIKDFLLECGIKI